MNAARNSLLISGAVLLLSFAAALSILGSPQEVAPPIQGAVLPTPKRLAEFQLRDHSGGLVDRSSFQQQWHLVSYGFTYCPDVCPTLLADLSRFQSLLDEQGEFSDLKIWFYSIDPARDSVEALANYVPWFDSDFVGLRADDAKQAQSFERSLGIRATITGTVGNEDYQVAHGFRLYLIDESGRLRAALAPTRMRDGREFYEPEVLLKDYLALRDWVRKSAASG